MPNIFELSTCEIAADKFFSFLLAKKANLVLDVRLKNCSQLCGFTKAHDLEYFCRQITHADYIHDLELAPSQEILKAYLKDVSHYEEYFLAYEKLLAQRQAIKHFFTRYSKYKSIVLLGTATKARHSHTEILLKLLTSSNEKQISPASS